MQLFKRTANANGDPHLEHYWKKDYEFFGQRLIDGSVSERYSDRIHRKSDVEPVTNK